MLPELPDDLKYILPYLQRASELKMRDPVVAYYCEFYAANLALQKGYPKTETNERFLMALLDQLGAEKEALKSELAIQENAVGKTHMIQFALKIFLAADNEDRSGQATKKTARLFLVASHFMETLRVFGEVGDEIEDRIRYAKWKASDIVKALNEGRQPVSGPSGAKEESVRSPSLTGAASSQPRQQETYSPPPHQHQRPDYPSVPPTAPLDQRKSSGGSERNLPNFTGSYNFPPPSAASPPAAPQRAPSPPTSNSAPSPPAPLVRPPLVVSPPPHVPYAQSPHAAYDQAEKHCRYATSAIQFEDVPSAIKEMETAIAILRALQQQK